MPPSDRTVRLQNKTGNNLSLSLQQLRAPASSGLRRGLLLTPILIRSGSYYDMCKELGLSFEDALRLAERSPDVNRFSQKQHLAVIKHPPEPEDSPVPSTPPPALAPVPVDAVDLLGDGSAVEPVIAAAIEAAAEIEPELEPTPVVSTLVLEEPTMDWSEDRLRSYAKSQGIDVSSAKSKTAVLRAIRKGN